MLRGMQNIADHPEFKPDFRVLVDYRGVEKYFVPEQALAEMGQRFKHKKGTRKAFVVSSGYVGAVARLYGALHATEEVEVFGDRKPALAWLNQQCPEDLHLTEDDLQLETVA